MSIMFIMDIQKIVKLNKSIITKCVFPMLKCLKHLIFPVFFKYAYVQQEYYEIELLILKNKFLIDLYII